MVAFLVGRKGTLEDQDRSLQLAWEWLLPEAHGWLDSVVLTLAIRIERGSLVVYLLAWLSHWLEVTVDVVAMVCLTWNTISVTA